MKKTLMGSLVLLAAAWMLQSCESSPEALNLDAAEAIRLRNVGRFERIVDESGATICGREPIRAAKQRVSAAAEKVAKFKLKVVND